MSMSDEDISKKLLDEADQEEQQEQLDQETETQAQAQAENNSNYEAALNKGFVIMGAVRKGIEYLEKDFSFGDEKAEIDYMTKGAHLHAELLKDMDTPELPQWVKDLIPWFKLAGFHAWTFKQVFDFRKHRLQAEQEGAEHGEKPEPETTE